MQVRMCVNNLDLHAVSGVEKVWLRQIKGQLGVCDAEQLELEEVHCLGQCYRCQQGPFAFAENKWIFISKSEGVEFENKP